MAPCHAMERGVGHRRSEEAKSGVEAEREAVQSWSCDGDGARGDSAHGGDDARPMMSGGSVGAAAEDLVQDRRANQTGEVAASEVEGHVVVVAAAVAVELYNAFAAAAEVVVVAAAAAVVVVAAVAAACATCIPCPAGSARSPLCRVHPARKRDHHDVRGLSLASSH